MEVNSVVYCIGNLEHSVCKIGYSQNVNKRLTELQTGCPFKLSILSVKEGGYAEEQVLHGKFRRYSLHGEWFKTHKDILDYFNVTDVKAYFNIYSEYTTILDKLSSVTDVRILMLLASYVNYNEYCITVDSELRKQMIETLKITTQNFSNCIKRLSETDLLKKKNNRYEINPLYIWKGSEEERKKLILDLNL